jgi:plasmid stabilization system protein ParE
MTRYTVVWIESAQNELADLWIRGEDRSALNAATRAVDAELAVDALTKGSAISEGLRALSVRPVRVLFAVREYDRIVEVLRVRTM